MSESRPESGERPGESDAPVTGDSPEELLAEALRAKAGQTGSNASAVADESQTDRITQSSGTDQRNSPHSDIPDITMGWVMVLAVLLGLATGALIGLLTVV
ncbi:hypothetical protein GCM10025762_10170 [Haloechinothrix salitolerans]